MSATDLAHDDDDYDDNDDDDDDDGDDTIGAGIYVYFQVRVT